MGQLLLMVAAAVAAVLLYRRFAEPAKPDKGVEEGRRSQVSDLTECAICGTYVAETGARACGRADCPYRR